MQNQLEVTATTPAAQEDHMKEIILQYVQEENSNPHALMINGQWGSGKTYYVKEVLSEEIEKRTRKKVLYVSLNGVSSTSEVSEQLFFKSFHVKEGSAIDEIKKNLINIAKTGSKIAGRWLKIQNDDFKGFGVKDFLKYSECVLVFDDLERLSKNLPTTDMLGFINTHFSEHDKIKILIIGNESEIKEPEAKAYFNEKEKVIGRTLEFKPKTIEVAKSHINGLTAGSHKSFLKAKEQFLLDRIEQAKITNLRTLFFFFDSLATIVQSLEKGLLDSFGEEILLQTFMFSNEYKNGRLEKYSSFDEVPEFFKFIRSIPAIFRGNEEKDKEKSDFKRRYSFNNSPTTPLIKEIHDYIRYGYLDSEKLQNQFKKRLVSEHTPEVEAIIKLHPTRLPKISNEGFKSCVATVIESVSEKKYDFTNFIWAFNTLHDFFEDGLLPIDGIETESKTQLNVLFTDNVSSIRNSHLTTLHEDIVKRKLKKFKNDYQDLHPDFITALEKEIEDYLEHHQKELLSTAFTDFMSNPMADSYWQSIGSFVQYFSSMLINDLKDALENSHLKANDYGVAFGDWASEETYPKPFHRNETEQNFANILEEIKQFEKGLDYSQKPLNKYFNGYLIRALQLSYDKAQLLCTEEKEEKDRQQKEQSTT